MDRELYYSAIDSSDNSAVMRLYGMIGNEVDGSAFVTELLYLINNKGITNISIRINSGGGSVMQAFTIFSAITNCKADITTYNDGVAGSCAGWIFLAGKNAVMADYSMVMVHNPYSADNTTKGLERLEMMRSSIVTILAKRTGNAPGMITAMMNEETWMDASEALAAGFATSIEETPLLIKLVPQEQTVNAMYEICNSAITKKEIEMTDTKDETVNEVIEEVTNEVVEETVEETVEEVVNETAEEVIEEAAPLVADVVNAVDIVNYVNRIAELETELKALKDAESQRVADEKQAAGVELVNNAVAAGKINSDAKAEMITLAVSNYSMAKTIIDAIQVNKTSVDIMNAVVPATDKPKMGLREMEKNNAKEVENLYFNNRPLYNQLYFEQYGVMPK